MSWWEAVILGIVQGLTEFLPISSSAHIRVLGPLLPGGGDPGAAFTAIIQIGTEVAVLIYFRKEIAGIIRSWLRSLRDKSAANAESRLGWWIILGTIPIVIAGLLGKDHIETTFRHLMLTAAVLAIFGVILGYADKVGTKKREMESLRARDAVLLGLAQAAALIPGVSRSGGTITMGLFLGLKREVAARYAFLLAVPAVLGSGFFELASSWEEITAVGGPGLLATAIATVVAFGVGFLVIVWFLKLISHHTFKPFVIYRLLFAALIVVLVLTDTVPAIHN